MADSTLNTESRISKLSNILFFTFSDKLKFSIKVSLSMVLAYLIPLSQGWNQASTAAITVMLIAAMGSVTESVSKGAMRVVGTIIGAIIGMSLIALFPQERVLYLITLSIIVAIPLYLVRAYKGDPSVFMLTAMTMMLVFKNGEVDDVFIYGIDKTYMTIFGIMVYALVGVFLWPVNVEDNSTQSAVALSNAQFELFNQRHASKEKRDESLQNLLETEAALEKATIDVGSANIDMQQWHSLKHSYKRISTHLTLLAMHDQESHLENIEQYVSGYEHLKESTSTLFTDISSAWQSEDEVELLEEQELVFHTEKIKSLIHIQRATLITTVQDMKKLHNDLKALAVKLNRIHSAVPTYFDKEVLPQHRRFIWGDIEHLKGVLITFIIFWVATSFWIMTNPPGGFMIVVLATGLSVLTTFTPIKPSMLMIVFTLSFIFATFMYVVVLPNLYYGWELGVFIFVYSFISFHLVNAKVSIFFLLGLFTFGIANEMYYDFSLFLLILLMFYSFLMLLHIFYYVPYSTRPEHMFSLLKKRFFIFSSKMLKYGRLIHNSQSSTLSKISASYAQAHLKSTVSQMQMWANGIDESYFHTLDKQKLLTFTKVSEKFAYLVELLYDRELNMKGNPLLEILAKSYTAPYFSDLLLVYAKETPTHQIDPFWNNKKEIEHAVENRLHEAFETVDFDKYERKDVATLYEILSLRRNVWLAFFEVRTIMEELDFKVLKQSRF